MDCGLPGIFKNLRFKKGEIGRGAREVGVMWAWNGRKPPSDFGPPSPGRVFCLGHATELCRTYSSKKMEKGRLSGVG